MTRSEPAPAGYTHILDAAEQGGTRYPAFQLRLSADPTRRAQPLYHERRTYVPDALAQAYRDRPREHATVSPRHDGPVPPAWVLLATVAARNDVSEISVRTYLRRRAAALRSYVVEGCTRVHVHRTDAALYDARDTPKHRMPGTMAGPHERALRDLAPLLRRLLTTDLTDAEHHAVAAALTLTAPRTTNAPE